MVKPAKIEKTDDYFIGVDQRRSKGPFFCRLSGYNQSIHDFILKYYNSARANGIIIEGKLQNPDNKHLAYYSEMLGMDFQLSVGFIGDRLKKWLPRMSESQRKRVTDAIYTVLIDLKQSGKNENMLKNTYIKFMCWLYYRFERVVTHLGEKQLPKILYEGNVSNYELLMLSVLASAGCDILLLQYGGETEYLKIDPDSVRSEKLPAAELKPFPSGFSLKRIQSEIQEAANNERLYGTKPKLINCTNAWISGKSLQDVRKDTLLRGNDPNLFYNCFCRIMGVEDRLTYENELYQLQLELKNSKRQIVIVSKAIDVPSMEEIGSIRRKNYQTLQQLIMDLSMNIRYVANPELQRLMVKAFVDVLLEEGKKEALNRLTNKAVYLLCWLARYQNQLFGKWKQTDIGCFFYMGGCKNESEALFLRFLARLPVDILIFNPNLNQKCCLEDPLLYVENYENSLNVSVFPQENAGLRVGTSAYHAERDLDELMYRDSGIYRNQQYAKANSLCLHTMYEEISILWEQELKYRPNFSTSDDVVNIPVIFAKICGVKDGRLPAYWSSIKKLLTTDTVLIKTVPNLTSTSENPMKAFATEFFRNGRLQKSKIKNHKAYQYGFLREEMQEHLLEKLQLLIDQKLIKGTFENGTEYTIVSVGLNLDKNLLRMLQKFDFTKKNPKLVYIITGETVLSLEDSIYASFLNLLGFDILFFVPTGYQCVEKYFNRNIMEDHQIGEYLYDLQLPDFNTISDANTRHGWRELLFKRGT